MNALPKSGLNKNLSTDAGKSQLLGGSLGNFSQDCEFSVKHVGKKPIKFTIALQTEIAGPRVKKM